MELVKNAVPYISAITALVAVFLGPLISLRIADKRIANSLKLSSDQLRAARENNELHARTAVLSKNRQEWIHELRKEIAEFIAQFQRMKYAPKHAQTDEHVKSEVISTMDKFYLSYLKINLLINPHEEDHEQLVRLLRRMHKGITEKDFDTMQSQRELIELSQRILKREWERVKEAA